MALTSHAIVPRRLRSELGRVLALALASLPRRVQRLGARALGPIAERWPALAELLGLAHVTVAPHLTSQEAVDGAEGSLDAPDVPSSTLLATLESSKDFVERARAARALASRRGESITEALVLALRDASAEVAVEAASALSSHPGDATVAALAEVLRDGQTYFSPTVRAVAVRTLGALAFEPSRSLVVGAVGDRDAEVSLAAIATLVERDTAGCAAVLLDLLENETGYYLQLTRRAAARGLASVAARGVSARVRELLSRESDPSVRDLLVGLERAPS